MRSDLVDLQVYLHHQTEKAILVSIEEIDDPVWLPKSRVEIHEDEPANKSFIGITLPERLAIEKELI